MAAVVAVVMVGEKADVDASGARPAKRDSHESAHAMWSSEVRVSGPAGTWAPADIAAAVAASEVAGEEDEDDCAGAAIAVAGEADSSARSPVAIAAGAV